MEGTAIVTPDAYRDRIRAALGNCLVETALFPTGKRRGKVRAGKLYYLRGLEGKAARIKEDLAAVAKAKAEKAAG